MEPLKALGILVIVDLAIVGVAALLSHLANRRAFPRMDDREITVLGCLWQVPRERGESARRYRSRLARSIPKFPRD